MKPSSKKSPKNLVLPHSQAKLDLYAGYIERYVQVLVASQKFQRINIYDVFCGAGIYDDGKPGSPIFAFEAIKRNREWCRANGKYATSISLTVNDGEPKKVNKVKEVLTEKNQPKVCDLHFHNLPADEIFETEDSINQFAEMLEQYMREKTRDNKQVYEFTLRKGFLPKNTNEILRQWLHSGKVTVWDIATKSKASARTFFIKYEDYKQPAKVSFKLN